MALRRVHSAWVLPVLAVLAFSSCAYSAPTCEEFFAESRQTGHNLPTDRVYPRGRLLPFSMAGVGCGGPQKIGQKLDGREVDAWFAQVTAAGFTMAGPQYELNGRALADAARAGISVVYSVGDKADNVRKSPAKAAREVGKQVQQVAENPAVSWWHLTPDGLNMSDSASVEYIEAACRAIRRYDPQNRPIWIHAGAGMTDSELAHLMEFATVAGRNMAVPTADQSGSRIWVRQSIEQELAAISGAETPALPIAVLQMGAADVALTPEAITARVRHDVFASLVAGAKGIIVDSLRIQPGFDSHGAWFGAYCNVVAELGRQDGPGEILLSGRRCNDLTAEVVGGPATLLIDGEQQATVSMANIAIGTERYVTLVNSTASGVRVRVNGLPDATIGIVDALAPENEPLKANAGSVEVALGPLGVRMLRISRPVGGAESDAGPEAIIHTNMGEIRVRFFAEDAPKTVRNFLTLSRDGFYNGLTFHRVIQDFMIQGGCPRGNGTGGPGYEFEDEINQHKIVRGALAMANAGPNTNGSQFFIVTKEACPWLDGFHTVFGEVVSGMDVVDSISSVATTRAGMPLSPVTIEKVELVKGNSGQTANNTDR